VIGIYKITNTITGKCYIGQSGRLHNRCSNHKKAYNDPKNKQFNDDLYKDMRLYGIENFKFEILETMSLDTLEEKWIQFFLNDGVKLYNKVLLPDSDKFLATRKFDKNTLQNIIILLKENKLSNIKISKLFNCSSATIDRINNGEGTYRMNNEIYPIRNFKKHKGEIIYNSLYSDEEVMQLRKKYINMQIKDLFHQYGKSNSYASFEQVILGRTYSHLPIYKKRQKIWLKDNKLYRLEP